MKNYLLVFAYLFFTNITFGQIGINTTGASADPSAMLDVNSTSKGILIPRMNTAQRTSISTPATGLMVYDITTNSYWFYNGSAWANLSAGTSFSLPYVGTDASLESFKISNTATGTAIRGNSNLAGSVGVYGSSTSGIGVKAVSVFGTALDVTGDLKIHGGNTNPSNGAVLTSDASGNATWQNNKIGFSAKNAANSAIPEGTYRKVEFNNEEYDPGNDFFNYAGATTSSSSVFTVPISGAYHVSTTLNLYLSSLTNNFSSGSIYLMKNSVLIGYFTGTPKNTSITSEVYLHIEGDYHFNANDKVWVEVFHRNSFASTAGFEPTQAEYNRFACHLIFAD